MASELIIQLQNQDGTFICEKYNNFPSTRSAYVAICFANNSSMQFAIDLKRKLIESIEKLNSDFIISIPPCGGYPREFNSCKALSIHDNIKLLIIISDGVNNTFTEPHPLLWQYTILPVSRINSTMNLPNPYNEFNAVFWDKNIDEVIPTIFGLVGISAEEQKIFISYRRTDTSKFAEQLFDRLSHEGFEVFLDRFSISPSVNFQNRLYQELADKAMVLLLESPDYQNSKWIQYEIAFAKKYRLGLLAINIDQSPKVPSIDDEFRRDVCLNTSRELDVQALDALIIDIKKQHSFALYRMKNYLTANIQFALESLGATSSIDVKGFISVNNQIGNKRYKIWATPRPPRVDDYHYSDISNILEKTIIIGPEFMEEKREVLNQWLAQKSSIDFYAEGQLLDLCKIIYP